MTWDDSFPHLHGEGQNPPPPSSDERQGQTRGFQAARQMPPPLPPPPISFSGGSEETAQQGQDEESTASSSLSPSPCLPLLQAVRSDLTSLEAEGDENSLFGRLWEGRGAVMGSSRLPGLPAGSLSPAPSTHLSQPPRALETIQAQRTAAPPSPLQWFSGSSSWNLYPFSLPGQPSRTRRALPSVIIGVKLPFAQKRGVTFQGILASQKQNLRPKDGSATQNLWSPFSQGPTRHTDDPMVEPTLVWTIPKLIRGPQPSNLISLPFTSL